MVIQIQFRYSQHTRLRKKGRRIGQVDWLDHVKDALSLDVVVTKASGDVLCRFTPSYLILYLSAVDPAVSDTQPQPNHCG